MILCDAGPLVALFNKRDPDHARCASAMSTFRGPLITTWVCLAEAMYLLGKYGGYPAQEELWGWIDDGVLEIHTTEQGERVRMRDLMRQYRDIPMDLGDASLVALAEALNEVRILTLDGHFFAYRLGDGRPFHVLL